MSDELETQDGIELGGARHIGEVLRARRLELGRELADIAHQTRVPMRHLTAIEEGKHDTLPALPYTIGFVKSYARILGLDSDTAVEQFRRETTKPDRVVPTMDHEPIEDGRVPTRAAALLGLVLLGLLALAVAAWGLGWFGGDEEPAVVEAPAGSDGGATVAMDTPPVPPPATAETPAAVAAADATATSAPPAPTSGAIVVNAREDAWVRIYEAGSGRAVFQGVMAAGDRYDVPADRQDLLLWTGRAGALDVTVGGTAIPPLGAATQTVRDVPLTAAGLAARGQPRAN
ncbi:RodZ domain-containing protein [Sphingosinicella soli]|uniref:Cytoskeletal protein RodZ n=1 Tax=Sphingosinicella soli TaxID=333708 RepID=A0A7W7F605_9SPHN|nr:cytoskeletal protein RodZ [Sphingosinicella soli]